MGGQGDSAASGEQVEGDVSKTKQECGGLVRKGSRDVSKCEGGHVKKRSIGHSLENALNLTIGAIV